MLEGERKLIIVAHGPAGGVELLLLLRGEMQLDDVRDAVATHDSGHAGVHIVLTVFAVQQNRNRKNAVLVVEDGANDLCGRSADAELGAALAAQDGPAALAARIGEDYADYINSLTDPEAAPQQAAPEPETAKPAGVQAWSARELSEMVLPPIRHVVEGLLPQGLALLVAPPKYGKSWLMLWLGLQVAQGNSIWGLPTLQCDVLYLSLEDTQRRIKDRLYNLTDSAPENLYFAVTSGLIGGGLEEQITDFLTEHPATKLVIIDTLQKVRDSKGSAGKAGMYGNDYDDISSIKRIADGFNIAILLVHHLRKLQDSDDPFNDVSGSTGIIGAADTNFILRRKRSGNAATLLVSGRDVEYQELTLQFNDLVWELVERKNSEDIHKAELPKFLFRVVDFMECRTEWVGTATELLTEMKEQEVTPNMVTKYLGQFAYEVLEPLGIEYRTKRTGKSRLIKFLRRDGDDASDAGIAI